MIGIFFRLEILFWVLAQVEPKQALLKAIAHAMAERAAQCNPQEISNCVWAFARLSMLSPLCSAGHDLVDLARVVCRSSHIYILV